MLKERFKAKIGDTKMSRFEQIGFVAKELKTAIVIHDNSDFYKFRLHGHTWLLKGNPSMHVRVFDYKVSNPR